MHRALAPETRALTVRQPWAWAIVHAGKDVENRPWLTHYRGLLLVHAGTARDSTGKWAEMRVAAPNDLIRGALIGVVEVVDCVRDAPSRWAVQGMWHWVLKNPWPVDPPVTCTGQLNLWKPNLETLQRIRQVLARSDRPVVGP